MDRFNKGIGYVNDCGRSFTVWLHLLFFCKGVICSSCAIFFVLSGYLFKQKDWGKMFHKNNLNLLLPYATTCSILIILSWIGFHFPSQHLFGTMCLTRNVIFASLYGIGTLGKLNFFGGIQVPSIGVIWFLVAMYCGNFLFNASLKAGAYLKNETLVVILISLLECFLGFFSAHFFPFPWSLNAALVSQAFYCGGFLIKKLKLMDKKAVPCVYAGGILWGLSALSGFFYLNTAFADMPIIAVLGGLGGSFVLMKLAQKLTSLKWNFSLVKTYGRLSLIVMCFHLIDITLIQISSMIYNTASGQLGPIVAVLAVVFYRVAFTIVAVLIIPYIPVFRSFYLNRRFPLFERKITTIRKKPL
ncbi:O-acetyltransferase [Liquorilactobacillus sucicola DSM 21376 = JCM 15457]|nr:O-acetyltransferase [Liquorilactobacillus sucicola DSM 21376 = JCM 15457]